MVRVWEPQEVDVQTLPGHRSGVLDVQTKPNLIVSGSGTIP